MEYLKIRNWTKWQTYRSDRGQPPWIKIHRCIMRDPDWVSLSDAERGQLVALWLLAADHDGAIPTSKELIAKLCFMSGEPNLSKFADLGFIEDGWRRDDAVVTPSVCRSDVPKAEAKEDKNKDSMQKPALSIILKNESEYPIFQTDIDTYQEFYPNINILTELTKCRAWNYSNPQKRKTKVGMKRHINGWLSRASGDAPPKQAPPQETGEVVYAD